jgi:hypothetical protein
MASRSPVRAYCQSTYAEGRWRWIVIVNDDHHSVVIAQSTATFPTEHDANSDATARMTQLLAGELASSRYNQAKHDANKRQAVRT